MTADKGFHFNALGLNIKPRRCAEITNRSFIMKRTHISILITLMVAISATIFAADFTANYEDIRAGRITYASAICVPTNANAATYILIRPTADVLFHAKGFFSTTNVNAILYEGVKSTNQNSTFVITGTFGTTNLSNNSGSFCSNLGFIQTGMKVVFTATNNAPNFLTSGGTYYVVGVNGQNFGLATYPGGTQLTQIGTVTDGKGVFRLTCYAPDMAMNASRKYASKDASIYVAPTNHGIALLGFPLVIYSNYFATTIGVSNKSEYPVELTNGGIYMLVVSNFVAVTAAAYLTSNSWFDFAFRRYQ
jgi:hypothetical protein